MCPIGIPFFPLALNILTEYMLTQRLADDLVGGEAFNGLVEGARETVNAFGGTGLCIHGKDVLCNLRRRGHALFNAVKTCRKAYGHVQIGVAAGIRAAQLDTCGLAAGGRNTDQGAAVAGTPGQIAGGLITGHQTLIAVDQRIGNGRHSPDMGKNAGNEGIGFPAQAARIGGIRKDVFPLFKQGHVGVHA